MDNQVNDGANIGLFQLGTDDKAFMMIDAALDTLLRSETLAEVVHDLDVVLSLHGADVTPAGVEAARRSAPEAWRLHLPILLDITLGTRRAERSGKAVPGWLFTSVSAQQATHPGIAEHHALAFDTLDHVVEVCTGAGLDTRALAMRARKVTTFESDPVTAAIAAGNLMRTGIRNVDVITARVPGPDYLHAMKTAKGLWADPARRDEAGRRARRGSVYDPPIGLFTTVDARVDVVGVKVGPGDMLDAEVVGRFASEYVGWRDECRERVLWRGLVPPLVTLPDVGTTWSPNGTAEPRPETIPMPGAVLVEPHAAVIASGAVDAYFASIGASVIDRRIAYGLCDLDPGPSPLHRRFRIVDVERGIDAKRMQRMVRTRRWGAGTEIKKRGVDIDPMSHHRALEFVDGGPSGVIVLTRGVDERWTIYAERLSLLS